MSTQPSNITDTMLDRLKRVLEYAELRSRFWIPLCIMTGIVLGFSADYAPIGGQCVPLAFVSRWWMLCIFLPYASVLARGMWREKHGTLPLLNRQTDEPKNMWWTSKWEIKRPSMKWLLVAVVLTIDIFFHVISVVWAENTRGHQFAYCTYLLERNERHGE